MKLLIKIFIVKATCLLILLSAVAKAQCGQFITVSVGGSHSLAIKADGSLWTWGGNAGGQLGDGTRIDKITPINILPGTTWTSVSAGNDHSIAVKSDGTLWAWGRNANGQVDSDLGGWVLTPVQIGTSTQWADAVLSAGYGFNLVVSGGTLYAWGNNQYGQLGDGTRLNKGAPTLIGTGWIMASASLLGSHSTGIKTGGTLWTWGYNSKGQLGDGTNVSTSAPAQVGSTTGWKTVTSGDNHSVAIQGNGSLWAWGGNFQYQLGDGTQVDKNSPVQIGTGTNWQKVSAGVYYTIALQTDSSLWGWGHNNHGQLGTSIPGLYQSSPTFISTEDWELIDAGNYTSFGIQQGKTLWAWGKNTLGEFGDGTDLSRNTPKQLSSGGGYASISNSNAQSGMEINSGVNQLVYNCGLIASLAPNGTNPVSSYTTASVWIENAQPAQYAKRHYEITPATNSATATGRVTLYFTQQEFNDFNSVPTNTLKLPTFSSDTRKANLKIEKRGGTSADNTGLPDTYPGAAETIDPVDTDIVWNGTLNAWEVSFDVTGFSGFFVKTQDAALPVAFGNIKASIKNGQLLVNWQTLSETNNSHFIIEASADGVSFNPIGRVASLSTEGNSSNIQSYQFEKQIDTMAVASLTVLSLLLISFRRIKYLSIVTGFLIAVITLVACNKGRSDLAVSEADDLYIRIVQVDKDGGKSYSKVVKVEVK